MKVNADLHCHSGASGGVGNLSLEKVAETMPLKGIDLLGTGDCQHPQWNSMLKEILTEISEGVFTSKYSEKVRFILQTELIFTCAIGKGRKSVHIVFLFPSFDVVDKIVNLFEKWDVKNTIGRPFVKCEDNKDVANKLFQINQLDDLIEIIPAHILTPQGIYGSNNPINHLSEFFGDAEELIYSIETGLSADPIIIGLIPELDKRTLISNSDAHSHHLARLGREFTTLEINSVTYPDIIKAIRTNKITRTCEFNPAEGRYFLSGHRAGKQGHGKNFCVYSPKHTPKNKICPICGKPITIGVLERAFELSIVQGGGRELGFLPKTSRPFVHMVPLVEILAESLGIKSTTSKTVLKEYQRIIHVLGNECEMWFMDPHKIEGKLEGVVDEQIIQNILEVRKGNFTFEPFGYDGTYGKLRIGEIHDFLDVDIGPKSPQRTLF
ncbi:MAG: endonuclease Q family protein [Candidatus Helarchaeota archaeon]